MAKSGSEGAAAKFVWVTKWWAHIGGWLTSLATIYFALDWCLDVFSGGNGNNGRLLMSGKPNVAYYSWGWGWGNLWPWNNGNGNGSGNGSGSDGYWDVDILLYGVGATALSLELAAWIMYYYSLRGSLAYGRELMAAEQHASEQFSDEAYW